MASTSTSQTLVETKVDGYVNEVIGILIALQLLVTVVDKVTALDFVLLESTKNTRTEAIPGLAVVLSIAKFKHV